MAWFHDYSRDYDRASGYNRGRNPRDTPGMRSSNFGSDNAWGSRGRWSGAFSAYDRGFRGGYDQGYGRGGYWGESSTRVDYNRDYMGRQYGYGSDYDQGYRRRPPEESPLYGRGADQAVQGWARRYGYDMQYEINPNRSGGSAGGGYGGAQRNLGDTQRGYGGSDRVTYRAAGNQGRGGGYGGSGGYPGYGGGYGGNRGLRSAR